MLFTAKVNKKKLFELEVAIYLYNKMLYLYLKLRT